MKYTIARYTLILFLVPLVLAATGCEITPRDKWPAITYHAVSANYDVRVDILQGFGIPQLKVPNRNISVTVNVRTYHSNQQWEAKFFLESVEKFYTKYINNLPGPSYRTTLPISEVRTIDKRMGKYLEGSPPQGIVELVYDFQPDYFPLSIDDWIVYEIDPLSGALTLDSVTDRYIYHFRLVLFDAGGRSDTFEFQVISTLLIDDDN